MRLSHILAVVVFMFALVGCSTTSAESKAHSEDKILCDKFKLQVERSGSEVMLAVDTDLPDEAVVMVSVSRAYREKGNSNTYSVNYLSERNTIGKWRKSRTISISDSDWQKALKEKQEKMSGLGLGFEVESISKQIEARMVVPINQPDPRFGKENRNLIGSRVEANGLRVVKDEVELAYPLK